MKLRTGFVGQDTIFPQVRPKPFGLIPFFYDISIYQDCFVEIRLVVKRYDCIPSPNRLEANAGTSTNTGR